MVITIDLLATAQVLSVYYLLGLVVCFLMNATVALRWKHKRHFILRRARLLPKEWMFWVSIALWPVWSIIEVPHWWRTVRYG